MLDEGCVAGLVGLLRSGSDGRGAAASALSVLVEFCPVQLFRRNVLDAGDMLDAARAAERDGVEFAALLRSRIEWTPVLLANGSGVCLMS